MLPIKKTNKQTNTLHKSSSSCGDREKDIEKKKRHLTQLNYLVNWLIDDKLIGNLGTY